MYEVQSGCTKYEVQSTKYGIGNRMFSAFIVPSTKYKVLSRAFE
jgi:hypothetical protein